MSEETRQVTAEQVRAAFPQCVAFADECRAVFGMGVTLNYASENGREIGRRTRPSPETTLTTAQMIISVPEEEQTKQGRRNGR